VQRRVNGEADIWLTDLARGASLRLTTEDGPDEAPMFSPDGNAVIYSALARDPAEPERPPSFQLFQRPLARGPSVLVLATAAAKQVTDWSSDGRFLLYRTIDITDTFDMDLWVMPLYGDRKPFVLVDTPFEERDARFSPDGRWVVYQSNDSGRFEIYAQSFLLPGERRRLSRQGGVQPRWRADGRELFYVNLDGDLMAIPTDVVPGAMHTGPEVRLFRAPIGETLDIALHRYVASRDGQRFLIDTVVEESAAPIVVILNWQNRH
jgi:Tol biopolymer transport system component